MLKNYFKIALRNLWKHKTFTITNITGLAIAFGATLLLCLTAVYELSYDAFHEHKDQLFQLYREQHRVGKIEGNESFPIPFSPALKNEYPDLAHISRFGEAPDNILRYGNRELSLDIMTADPDFLRMFTFPLLQGDPGKALNDPNGIVLTEKSREKIFGQDAAIGQTIELKTDSGWKPYKVTAIAADIPENSTITFSGLINFENFQHYTADRDDWDKSTHSVYIQLAANASLPAFEQKLKKFAHTHYGEDAKALRLNGATPDKEGEYIRIRGIAITGLHFNTIATSGAVNKFYPYLLLLISAFILFIASVNFVNLSLGRAFTRTREIGMRKVLGARRRQILYQFWGEALLICLASFALGIILARLFLSGYKTLFNQALSPAALASPWFIASVVIGFALVSLLAGGYPAWVLSALNASRSVKGKITVTKNHRLRNGLMIVQFVLSGLLIICTSIVWQQLNYMRKAPLGYNKDQVISIPIGSQIKGQRALDLMRSGLANIPGVLSVSGTDINLGRGRDNNSSTSTITFTYKGHQVVTNWLRVDYDYLKTLDIRMLQGRDFSRAFASDSNAILINEKMAATLGEKDAVNKDMPIGHDGPRPHIIGVVKDFHFKSLHREIAPLTMTINPEWGGLGYIFVKVSPANLPGSMAAVEKVWKKINPKAEADISFLNENTDKQYRKETRLSKIFISGALLAIIISCMGLFAIVVLVMGQRTREIGIRKVLGASVADIFTLVAREFLQLVLVAVIISSPVAWWLMHQWLEDFAYRIHISIWIFLFAALAALLIALFTVSFQALRAAWLNPVDNLRSE